METTSQLYEELAKCQTDEAIMWIAKGVPQALLKAQADPFEYALGLKDGTVIYFEECELGSIASFNGWVTINKIRSHTVAAVDRDEGVTPICFARGMEVHLSAIAWVADAPFGS